MHWITGNYLQLGDVLWQTIIIWPSVSNKMRLHMTNSASERLCASHIFNIKLEILYTYSYLFDPYKYILTFQTASKMTLTKQIVEPFFPLWHARDQRAFAESTFLFIITSLKLLVQIWSKHAFWILTSLFISNIKSVKVSRFCQNFVT